MLEGCKTIVANFVTNQQAQGNQIQICKEKENLDPKFYYVLIDNSDKKRINLKMKKYQKKHLIKLIIKNQHPLKSISCCL